jgi:hypothetical protein
MGTYKLNLLDGNDERDGIAHPVQRRRSSSSGWGQDFSPLHVIETGSESYAASYPIATGDSFVGGKAVGA